MEIVNLQKITVVGTQRKSGLLCGKKGEITEN